MGDRAVNDVRTFEFSSTDVTATGPVVIATLPGLDGMKSAIWFELENGDAAIAFDLFQLQIRAHVKANWVTIASTWATGGLQLHTSAVLQTLGATLRGSSYVNIGPCDSIRFRGSGNADNIDTCTVRGTIWRI